MGNDKAAFPGHILLQGFYVLILKFNYPSAPQTDEMIMMLSQPGRFKSAHLAVEFSLNRQTGLGQEFQRPVNRSQTHPWVF